MTTTRRGLLAGLAVGAAWCLAGCAGGQRRGEVTGPGSVGQVAVPVTAKPERPDHQAPDEGSPPSPSETGNGAPLPGAVDVVAGELTVRVRLQPWSIEAARNGATVVREFAGTAPNTYYGTLSYRRYGFGEWRHLVAVSDVAAIPNGQRFLATTSEPGAGPATVDATTHGPGVIRVEFRPPPGEEVVWTYATMASDSTETLLGLGERFDSVSLAGRQLDVWAEDRRSAGYGSATYLPAPWLLSSRGYGFLLDGTRPSTWELRSTRPDAWTVGAYGPTMAFYLISGQPAQAIDRYTALTGRPPMPPSLGFGVVKTLIGGTKRVLADAARLRRDDIPVDGIYVYDAIDDAANLGWPGGGYDAIAKGSYPSVRELTDQLRALGYRPLAYFSPDFRPDRKGYQEAAAREYLVRDDSGNPWVSPLYGISKFDFTNPEAVRWWQQGPLRRALIDLGFDGGMFDLGDSAPPDGRYYGGATGTEVHNAFPVAIGRAIESGLMLHKPDALLWLRSGFTGGQRFSKGVWSGDPVHNWLPVTGFQSIVPATVSAGLAGYAYWHTEVGGYVDGGLDPAGDRELYLRWLQLGAFTTMLRDNYGDRRGKPADIWTDQDTLRVWRRYARIHQALRPYLQRAALQAQRTGLPLLRHLAIAFPDDPRAWAEQQQFLVGDDLLIAPVIEPGMRRRTVYLPGGQWRDWWSGVHFTGPVDVVVPAPLDRIPIFVRGGAASPLPPPSAIDG